MKLLLKNVLIQDPHSPYNGQKLDVLVSDGKYLSIEKEIAEEDNMRIVGSSNAVLMPGWFDTRVSFCEPGEEQKETIRSGQNAAAAGGFTGVLMMPSTLPPIETAADISFVKDKSRGHAVDVFPAGVLTEKREGKHISGMFEMQQAGAPAFTDGKRFLGDSGVMLRCMQYARQLNAPIISFADDPGLTGKSMANESDSTVMLGMKGMPAIAEKIAIERDLNLCNYSGVPLHLSGVSTRESVEAIRHAKKQGIPVTAEVYVHHLLLDDSELQSFGSEYKVMPPLRTKDDVMCLREALLDGTIDMVCSDHSPQDIESKYVEFEYASFGMIGLESFYGVLNTAFSGHLDFTTLYRILVESPRKMLGFGVPTVSIGEMANFTLFDPSAEWEFSASHIQSKSSNSPFIGRKFTGKVLGICNNDHVVIS